MSAVSDTSPLNYLVLLSSERLLEEFYGRVFIPREVAVELQHALTPAPVRRWLEKAPGWLTVRDAPETGGAELNWLDPGEAAALRLALELQPEITLIDERRATRVAKSLGLEVTGTPGVLRNAHIHGLLDARKAYARLRIETTFRHNEAVYQGFMESLALRR